ncbi:MAG TPA: ABC transporter ATP-binding protein [Bryobacteraceae bacterium]|nr:ABC transporter ATP-binding protein [Bryobacteraceae bacterium]
MPAVPIEFERVTKVYKRVFSEERIEALSDISFQTAPGQVSAFLGPNGAGKTTSISLLMGFFFANSGKIRVLGYPPGDIRAKRDIGFLPENFAFYKFLTAPQLLRLHLQLAGRNPAGGEGRIRDLLAQVKLADYENLKIGKYSRGMVQRIGIAQALLCEPQLVVLDEPTSGLDPAGRREVLQILAGLKSEGKTIFLSSHILPEVEQIADQVIIINHGKLVRAGSLTDLLAAGNRVEILADRLPEDLEQSAAAQGVTVEHGPHGVRLLVDAARKRETVEALWTGGCDVMAMNPLRSTLEELFLKEVDDRGGAQ